MIFNDTVYNVLKRLVQVVIPAISSLYFGLGNIWGWPYIEQIVGTLAVFATTIGVMIGISSKQYNASGAGYDGNLVLNQDETGKKVFSLELNQPPVDLETKDSITFKVNKPDASGPSASNVENPTGSQ
jgi:Putative phage holin Dp-1